MENAALFPWGLLPSESAEDIRTEQSNVGEFELPSPVNPLAVDGAILETILASTR